MGKWTGLHGPITADAADAEPMSERLFGPSFDARMRRYAAARSEGGIDRESYHPWEKPDIIRPSKRVREKEQTRWK